MKQVLALGMVAVALAAGAVGAAGGTNPNTLTFAVYGDSPSLAPAFSKQPAAEFNATPAFIDTINADPSIQAVVHVGDIHSGSEACTVAYDQAIFHLWLAFQKRAAWQNASTATSWGPFSWQRKPQSQLTP